MAHGITHDVAKRLRKLNRTLAARTGQGKQAALRMTKEAGDLAARSVREARRLTEFGALRLVGEALGLQARAAARQPRRS